MAGRHHVAERDLHGLKLDLHACPSMPEKVRSGSDSWQERYDLTQVRTHINIHIFEPPHILNIE